MQRSHKIKLLGILIVYLFVLGCASQKSVQYGSFLSSSLDFPKFDAIAEWQAVGKISVTNDETGKSNSGRFAWNQKYKDYRLKLFGALGFGYAEIAGNEKQATIKSSRGKYIASSAEILLEQKQWPKYPVTFINYWLRGYPHPKARTKDIKKMADGSFSSFSQAGWSIRITEWRQYKTYKLPKKIICDKDNLSLKIVLSRWTFY